MKCDCHNVELYPYPKCRTLTCMGPKKEEGGGICLCPECGEEVNYKESKPTNLSEIGL